VNTGANFPSGNPLDPAGNLTPQWRMFFLTLFTRSGGAAGNDTSTLQAAIAAANANIDDLQTEDGQGAPAPDMAAVFGLIYVVEAIAAQAMAAASRQPDERGETGESASVTHLSQRVAELEGQLEHYRCDDALRIRIADLESKIEAIATPQIADASQLGLGTADSPTFAGVTSTGPVTGIGASTSTYAMTAARNGASSSQYVGLGGLAGSNAVDSYSASSNAKLMTYNATTTSSNTAPTSGSVGHQWSILGVAKMLLNQSGNLLVGTTTDDGSGNPIQSNAGLSIKPSTTTTAPAAGGAGALPATPLGYATIRINGTDRKVAYY
jgi:hypothetical protein